MQNDGFWSSDTYEAALLYISGLKVKDTRRDGHRVAFEFEDADKCRETIKKYLCHEMMVDAREYIDGIRAIKAMVFACKQ